MAKMTEGTETYTREDGCVCPTSEKQKSDKCQTYFNTCPYDPRFPNQNQTKRCYFSFIDYQRCVRLLGDYPGCMYFLKCYKSLCPSSWTERWFDQMEKGTFPRKIYPSKPIVRPPKQPFCKDKEELLEEKEPPKGSGTGTGVC